MISVRKLLIAAVMALGLMSNGAQAISHAGFECSLLKPLIARAKKDVDAIATSLNAVKATCIDAKAFAKNLYQQQKNALKTINAELKRSYKAAKLNGSATWFADKQLYKAFKKLVYKYWKKTRLFPSI